MSDVTEQHAEADERVIAAEITRCILGGPERMELRVDFAGRITNALQVVARGLVPALQKFDRALSEAGRTMADHAEQYANGEG